MKRKIFVFAMLALTLLAGLAPAASAQAPGVTMNVTAAYDGNFKYGEWLPLYAEIENKGADANAELQVRVKSGEGGTVFAAEVPLPAGARKLVPLYVVPNNFSRTIDVRLVSGDQLLVSQQVKVNPQPNVNYMVGFVAASRGALSLISGADLPGDTDRQKVLVDIPLEELPERAEGLASFGTLVLNDVDTSKLTKEQGNALRQYVEAGGQLVIGGGAGAQRTFAGLPESIWPVKLTGTQDAQTDDLSALAKFANADAVRTPGPFVLAAAANDRGGRILAGTDAQPLVVERTLRRGAVDFIALDLSAAPFEGWGGSQGFWSALINQFGAFPNGMPTDVSVRQMRSSNYIGALSSIPSLSLPSISSLSILLGLFVLLVGPINYFVLKRSRRLHLAWVTIPAITLIFAAGAFWMGYAMRGNDLVLNKIAVVQVQDQAPAQVTSYVGLFSPSKRQYELEVKGGSLLSPANQMYYDPNMPDIAGRDITFVQGNPSVIRGLSVNQWALQTFVAESTWEDFGKLSGDLYLKDNEILAGTVKNDTPYTITDAAVIVNRRFQKLGDLKPGQEVSVNLGLSDLSKDFNGPPLSYKMYQQPFSDTGKRLPRDVMMKSQMIDSTLESPIWMKFGVGNPMQAPGGALQNISFIGWLNQAPLDVNIRGSQRLSQVATSLVFATFSAKYPESGRVSIAPGLISARVATEPVGMGSCGPTANSVFLDNAKGTFEFQVPEALRSFTIQSLKVSLFHDNPTAAQKSVEVYDWSKDSWVKIDSADTTANTQTQSILLAHAGGYLNEDGLVRVRVSVGSGNPSCYYVDLGFQAEKTGG